MIRAEYLRFLQRLNNGNVSSDVCKIGNLVFEHLDDLIPLSTAQGQRVKKVVELAQANLETISSEIQTAPEQVNNQNASVTQLKSINIGPFRGFAKEEVFDLGSRLVLIYGPNGTGKSSFCEALEYGLLGNVAEAESKRFFNQSDYLKNAHTNTFKSPTIMAFDNQGHEVQIDANEALYRFCFVEKNRIDNFSRIAAQVPAKQTLLISTLFGLDSFNRFVHNFTTEIDGRYIDLVGQKALLLQQKRQGLAGSELKLKENTETLQNIVADENNLTKEYREDAIYNQMVIELNGDENNAGTIKTLEAELQKTLAVKSGLTSDGLQGAGKLIYESQTKLVEKQQELAAASQEVAYKQLFEAVSQLQTNSPENCPACKTPIHQAAKNPYIYASEELQKLHHLSALQQEASNLQQKVTQALQNLLQIVSKCCSNLPTNNPLLPYQTLPTAQITIDWGNSLYQKLQDGFTAWQHIEAQVKHLEQGDIAIDEASQLRVTKQQELLRLRGFAQKITELQTRRNTAQQAVSSAQQAINTFDTENAQLISDVEAEKLVVEKNKAIASAYKIFVSKLNTYKESLPRQLVANLGESVVELYNAFNRNDCSSELLATVRLPLTQNQRLEISFQNNPDKFFDALHVLSEGHIRCIGLAILLAKNLKEGCPILIFDDPVNAIDDDHRESIRKTLFEDSYFSDKQIILTCHGEEFFKDIQNMLPSTLASQLKAFTFLPRLGESHIRIDFDCAPRNYIIAARDHFDRNEIRFALTKARQALEALMKNKVWSYVNKYGDGNLRIKKRAANAPIELRNLTEQLKSKITKSDFGDTNKSAVLEPLNTLLGMNGTSREWRYLNKGTHEESNRAEFDRQTVNEIITALEKIDCAFVS